MKMKNLFKFLGISNLDIQLSRAGLSTREFQGLVAKVGSSTSLHNFEEILSKLDNSKDAIMIDRAKLSLELKKTVLD